MPKKRRRPISSGILFASIGFMNGRLGLVIDQHDSIKTVLYRSAADLLSSTHLMRGMRV
jgi:hypothetical protein